jgi:hypothetical protein
MPWCEPVDPYHGAVYLPTVVEDLGLGVDEFVSETTE